ncbi:MAG: type IV toxin-antitoxin system AbiEi family antitoxin domain-containing protein [Armatimonadetes bacterium]|nr:type IV toxin-antitoxin system AbiEi family antitoxin domain-containing protein [Armatimonadota bacterium]
MNPPRKSTQIIEPKVRAIVAGQGRGWVFTPRDFTELGDPRSVGMALTRLTRKGIIRQVARGLYDYPVDHPALGQVAPSADAIAGALASRDAVRLQPAGGYAANLLGLSDQVPMRVVFLTDGPPRRVKLGRREIILKRTTPRNMATAGKMSGLVIQALRHLGQRYVDDRVIDILRRQLSDADKAELLKDLKYAPVWIGHILRRLADTSP